MNPIRGEVPTWVKKRPDDPYPVKYKYGDGSESDIIYGYGETISIDSDGRSDPNADGEGDGYSDDEGDREGDGYGESDLNDVTFTDPLISLSLKVLA